jgi:uncharacterized protein (DUF1786 family)
MKILAIDIGTGTQDIFLFDPHLDVENAYKLVLPAPTMIVRRKIQRATREGTSVLLQGVTMGGGPCAWAAEDHLRAGFPVYATPEAARTFNDDLDAVAEMGVKIVSGDEAHALPTSVLRLELRDLDLDSIRAALAGFGIELDDLSAVAAAVFDHGAAPADISDRQFRFDYLDERIKEQNRLSAFAYLAQDIPPIMTRLQAVANSAGNLDCPLVVMDTAPAAVLGATFDPRVRKQERSVIANVGNFHTLAFRLGPGGIEGVFEHHTGLLTLSKLEALLHSLADGSLKHADVFNDHGHGALIYDHNPLPLEPGKLVVTGPRRAMLRASALAPYYAVPFGDMMIAGCFGLLAATADLLPGLRDLILTALSHPSQRPPWE